MRRFHQALPAASLFIIDNNSTDATGRLGREILKQLKCRGGVIFEGKQGKGNAVRRAFLEIQADIYVLVDADLTYSEKDLPALMAPVLSGECDMCVGDRHGSGAYVKTNKRKFHNLGNHAVKTLVNFLFKSRLKDIMSGYRVFNRFFIKNFPVLSEGFEIETEISLHAIDKRFRVKEIPVRYDERPPGSSSKLRTVQDGFKVTKTIFNIFKYYKPMPFFLFFSFLSFASGIAVGIPVIIEFMRERYVYKVPSAVLSAALMILATLLFIVGVILDTVTRNSRYTYELNLIHYKTRQ